MQIERDIRKVHEDVLQFLIEKRRHEHLNFGFRRSNRENKLEQGYWFYGNEKYLAVSFWAGMDWKNRTPNLFFLVNQQGETSLAVSVSDSNAKASFIESYFLSRLSLKETGSQRWIKHYNGFGNDYIAALNFFLNNDKQIIDEIIKENRAQVSNTGGEQIDFIDDIDFEESFQKIEYYRRGSSLEYMSDWDIDEYIDGFQIRNFGPIVDTYFVNLKEGASWIFLTGENGTGKTSLLKAIASGLCHVKVPEAPNAYYKFNFNSKHSIYERLGNKDTSTKHPLLAGFCAYGASRLANSQSNPKKFSILKSMSKEGLTASLFRNDTVLIDIQDQINQWSRNESLRNRVPRRQKYIREILVGILPNVVDVRFSDGDGYTSTYYIEVDAEGREFPPVTFDRLASGLRSLVAMIGDMMIRLLNQQPNIDDPSQLAGLVIIDEIDIHLHPNLQKYLVEQLTATFPNVRFIASTHSPIPMLGAPPNSQFLKIERTGKHGVVLTDLSDLAVENLLPNALLSSELFGMDKLFERKGISSSDVRTEDTIEEIELNDHVVEELKKIASQLKKNDAKS